MRAASVGTVREVSADDSDVKISMAAGIERKGPAAAGKRGQTERPGELVKGQEKGPRPRRRESKLNGDGTTGTKLVPSQRKWKG